MEKIEWIFNHFKGNFIATIINPLNEQPVIFQWIMQVIILLVNYQDDYYI